MKDIKIIGGDFFSADVELDDGFKHIPDAEDRERIERNKQIVESLKVAKKGVVPE